MQSVSRFLCVTAALVVGMAGVSSGESLFSSRILADSSSVLAADFDVDGRVSLNDFFLFAGAFGQKATGENAKYDLSKNGEVGFDDFFLFSEAFGKTAPQSGPDEKRASNVTSIPVKIEEIKVKTPAGTEVLMVKVPAGDFTMGSDDEENESPIHLVYLDDYAIDKYEVTNALYLEFVKATGYRQPLYHDQADFNGPNQPVVGVLWDDAGAYCKWRGMYLPTEAQWEKTARGIDGRKYPWGNEDPDKDKNGIKGPEDLRGNFNSRYNKTLDVGSFPKGVSPYGAYDMAGNVWEWCADYYDKDYYKVSPRKNPTGPLVGTTRVVRGGSSHADDDDVSASYRGGVKPDERNEFVTDYVEAFDTARKSENLDDPESVKFQYRYYIGFRCVK